MNLKSTALPAVMKASLAASLLFATACAKPLEAPQGQVLTVNGIEVSVTDVKLAAIDLEGPSGAIATKKSTLIVSLKLINKSAEPLRYDLGWSTTSSTQATSPLLSAPIPDRSPMGYERGGRAGESVCTSNEPCRTKWRIGDLNP